LFIWCYSTPFEERAQKTQRSLQFSLKSSESVNTQKKREIMEGLNTGPDLQGAGGPLNLLIFTTFKQKVLPASRRGAPKARGPYSTFQKS